MYVSEGGIVDVGRGERLHAHAVIRRVLHPDLAVNTQEVEHTVLPVRREALKQGGRALVRKGGSENPDPKLRQFNTLKLAGSEHIHVLRQLESRVG